ncbi:hypothetical protein BT69DRAFT_1264010 [Atractiella rhizophila]|nr:hypothetical protein BT69DRAFT_1264010 [Atractiella rhizophila]
MLQKRLPYVIDCPLHGKVLIEEPVLVDLLHSDAVTRLEGIQQHGVSTLDKTLYLPGIPPINRLEHSIGAMLLVRRCGGSVEAQAAALLHDCAHTVFSHVTDTAFGYVVHEEDKDEYIATTDLEDILSSHGFDPKRVLNEHLFPLLELDSPAICADRLDYGLRDSRAFGYLSDEDVSKVLRSLIQRNGRMVLSDQDAARTLAEAYITSDERCWGSVLHHWIYVKAAAVIKLAMDKGLVSKSSLWSESDSEFWKRLELASSSLPELKAAIEDVHAEWECIESEDGDHQLVPKVRVIDPDVLVLSVVEGGDKREEHVSRLSEVDEAWRERMLQYKARKGRKVLFNARLLRN